MGWFGDILSAAAPDLIGGAVSIAGNLIGSRAANERSAEATRASIEALEAAKARGVSAIREGSGAARARFDPTLAQSEVGLDLLRNIAASDPARMTPSQEIAFEDLRRRNMNNIAASGLRGSGAATRAIQEGDRRFSAGAFDTNQARKDRAIGTLEGRHADTVRNLATLDEGEGRSVANTEIGTGTNVASTLSSAGRYEAENTGNAITGSAGVGADTIGSLGAIIAREI